MSPECMGSLSVLHLIPLVSCRILAQSCNLCEGSHLVCEPKDYSEDRKARQASPRVLALCHFSGFELEPHCSADQLSEASETKYNCSGPHYHPPRLS